MVGRFRFSSLEKRAGIVRLEESDAPVLIEPKQIGSSLEKHFHGWESWCDLLAGGAVVFNDAVIPPLSRSSSVMRGVLIAMLLTHPAWAQVGSELAPRALPSDREAQLPFEARPAAEAGEKDDSRVLVDRLREIRLRVEDDDGAAVESRVGGRGVVGLQGVTVEPGDLAEALAKFLGDPLTENGLELMIEVVLQHYDRHGHPVTEVFAPEQDLAEGRILLETVEGRVGLVAMEGVPAGMREQLARGVLLEPGALLRRNELQEQLDWFNRNPFRPAGLYAAPGAAPGEADLVLGFSSQRPWRVYAGYENSGAEAAGENRYLLGLNWGNAFGLDQLVSYQFTAGDRLDQLQAHAVTWEIPLHRWHHFLRWSGSWASIETDTTSAGTTVTSSGTSWQVSGMYGAQLPRWFGFRNEVALGAEFKSSDNFLVFGGTDAHPGSLVEVAQLRADYRAVRQLESATLALDASMVASPGGLSGRNDDEAFALFRDGADASYLYGRAGATWVQRLPGDWSVQARGEAQLATGALLPTEQFALGGHATVRGYEERDVLSDHGYVLSVELRAPALSFSSGPSGDLQIQLLGFLDHGTGWRDESGPSQEARQSLSSLGLGARLQAGSHLSLRVDLAAPLGGESGLRGHFGLTLAY